MDENFEKYVNKRLANEMLLFVGIIVKNRKNKNEKIISNVSSINEAIKSLAKCCFCFDINWDYEVIYNQLHIYRKTKEGENTKSKSIVKFYFNEIGCYYYDFYTIDYNDTKCLKCYTKVMTSKEKICTNCKYLISLPSFKHKWEDLFNKSSHFYYLYIYIITKKYIILLLLGLILVSIRRFVMGICYQGDVCDFL